MVDDEFELPNIKKKKELRLDDLDDLKLPKIQWGLDEWTKFSRNLDQLAGVSNMRKKFGLGESFRFLDESTIRLSEILVDNGTITNAGAVKAAFSLSLIGKFTKIDFMSQIKAMDTIISFREMSTNLDILKNSSIPHMSLFRGILNSIDEVTYKQLQEEEEVVEEVIENDLIDEDPIVIRPECLKVALNINMYVTVTENHVQSSNDVTEEEKKVWRKYVKPILNRIIALFLGWAFGFTMDSFMENVEPFEKIVEISNDYHYPIETTDIDVNDEP